MLEMVEQEDLECSEYSIQSNLKKFSHLSLGGITSGGLEQSVMGLTVNIIGVTGHGTTQPVRLNGDTHFLNQYMRM